MSAVQNITEALSRIDWTRVASDLHTKGYGHVPDLLTPATCDELIAGYEEPTRYRKTITMERYRFGLGEYKYFTYPLPEVLQTIRETIYPHLVPIADQWMEWLDMEQRFPKTLAELHTLCHEHGQALPTVLILRYGEGGHNTLHQDLYGEVFFPMQLVLFLNEPGVDYTGGEFVLTQQTPRAQSKAIVVQPRRGDMLIFTTNFRPVRSARGFNRAAMRHGVSEVHTGHRHTLGIIFHDALT